MEESYIGNANIADEDMLSLPEGEIGASNEEFPIEENTGRKTSIGFMTIIEDEEEVWSREESYSEFIRDPQMQIQVLEREDYRYIGEVKGELREGFGVCYYKNGSVYRGTYKSDRREGLGKLINKNGEIMQGELYDDCFNGYCELIIPNSKSSTVGSYRENRFSDYIIFKTDTKTFEGASLIRDADISIGKLYSSKKGMKTFMGEVSKYTEECGFGILLCGSSMYLGEIHNKLFENYIEMYSHDGAAYFGMVKKSLKQGICFSFSKDGKVCFGRYDSNFKNGPFFTFSNCHNLAKSSVRLEIFHYDFKSKFVDKMEPSKKYLMTNYPEYCFILTINYNELICKYNEVIIEEMTYLNALSKEK